MTNPVAPTPPSERPATVIHLQGVTVQLGGATILQDVNLDVRKGEFLALIGPSGGGKSTLLRVIGGLLKPASGTVSVTAPPAFVFQDYRLLPWRSVHANVNLPRELAGHGSLRANGGRGLSADEALAQVGMHPYPHLYPAQLSGGMRARVALARALAQSSDILLLDEPFAALDALVRERFNAELKHLHDKTGRTTILVTHSIREAVYLADRVAVLKNGHLVTVLDTHQSGRISAYTDGLEAELRALLGTGDSTRFRPPPERPRGWSWTLPLAAILLGLLAWHAMAAALAQPFLLPAPLAVVRELGTHWNELGPQLATTFRTAVLGALLGSALGVLTGYPLGKLPWLERFLSPLVVTSQSTPTIVLAPLLITWLGFGFLPGVIVAALSAYYPVMVATLVGVRAVERPYHELFDTLGATPWQRLRFLELPHALPVALGGLRLATSLALIGAVVWEFVSNQPGLGYAVNQARAYYNTPRQFAAITLLVLLGVIVYAAITTLERRALRHRERQ